MDKNIEKTDIELVDLIIKDPNNLKYLITKYEKRLYSYINNAFFFSKDDIDDILQEIFINS
jgi:DNA-directed RNA polymerase specialized sigma24 family protein